jgi:hypothetical protein
MMKHPANPVPKPDGGIGFGFIPDFAAWFDGKDPFMEGWMNSSAATLKNAFDTGQRLVAFSQARLQADMEAWRALMECSDPAELVERQQGFVRDAAQQYADELYTLSSQFLAALGGAAPAGGAEAAKAS